MAAKIVHIPFASGHGLYNITEANALAMDALGYPRIAEYYKQFKKQIQAKAKQMQQEAAITSAASAAVLQASTIDTQPGLFADYVPTGIVGSPITKIPLSETLAAVQASKQECTTCDVPQDEVQPNPQAITLGSPAVAAVAGGIQPAGAIDLNGPLVQFDTGALVVLGLVAYWLFFSKK